MTLTLAGPRALITDPRVVADAARALADGALVAHAFGNFYVITTRADEGTVRRTSWPPPGPPSATISYTSPPPTGRGTAPGPTTRPRTGVSTASGRSSATILGS